MTNPVIQPNQGSQAKQGYDFSGVEENLRPNRPEKRILNPLSFALMFAGDGVSLGNMAIGTGLVVAGTATMNLLQTLVSLLIATTIIASAFLINDSFGYRAGVPYVIHLRMAFGMKGAIISSILRGVPAIIWYGFQSWIGATGLSEIIKIATGGKIDSIPISFVILVLIQIILSLKGFHTIKWMNSLIAIILMSAFIYAFVVVLKDHTSVIHSTWVEAKGTWGIKFWSFTMAFLGNYAALFLSASDYSRELKEGVSAPKRFLMYFTPVTVAYLTVMSLGVMLASATGLANPVQAFAKIVNNDYITFFVSVFIVLGAVGVNLVANIVPAAYIIQLFTKVKYKVSVVIAGLLAMVSFPWKLIQPGSSDGLRIFILTYSAFLAPITAILVVDYLILRKQKVDINELYNPNGQFSGLNMAAVTAMIIGAASAFIVVDLGWPIGFVVGGTSYYLLNKFGFKQSVFKKGTIFDK
ncbi:allantoin permease [Bacillus sp. MUM 116]|uniref:NCS1 family transporter n=1 Tax=Bacillus sp. MUM 116 TaxID=1678002 RepID=UPI0008F591A9|nr:NCS1 family transporter [Bacillus sp. MUM 116]OIK14455.1 allantoin permease [Bacillus sp. MUM 116]